MKVTAYVSCALVMICLMDVANSAVPQDRNDPQLLESMVMDGKPKRPFCNAFTGCGRKRSSLGVPQNPDSLSGDGIRSVRLSFPLYRALLRAASQEINDAAATDLQEGTGDYRSQEVNLQEYAIPPRKLSIRERYDS